MNKRFPQMIMPLLIVFLASPAIAQVPNSSVVVEAIINREAPQFNADVSTLVGGRDGRVYLSTVVGGSGYLISMRPDGSDKQGQGLGHVEGVSAVNDQGIRAHALGHFAHKAAFFSSDNTPLGSYTEFDNVYFDAPQAIAAGSSGDFFALDTHAKRIVRLDSSGRSLKVFSLKHIAYTMQVCEPKRFYFVFNRDAACQFVDFDGKVLHEFGQNGPYALHDDGLFYTIARQGSDIMVLTDSEGKKAGEVKLDLGERLPTGESNVITQMAHLGDEVLIKRRHPTELFARYNRKTGEFKGAVHSEHEKLRLTLESDILTAGKAASMKVDFDPQGRSVKPIWHVWARPFGAPGWRELAWKNDQLQVPPDYAGLYQLKVSDETNPIARGVNPEYLVETIVEVRTAGSQGTISVMTPENRVYYGRGETISAGVIIRSPQSDSPKELTVQLREGGLETAPGKVIHEQKVAAPAPTSFSADPAVPVAWPAYSIKLPGTLTKTLKPGSYILSAAVPKLTCVAQTIVIGPGAADRKFWRILHGDMVNFSIIDGTPERIPDAVSAWKEKLERLGFNAIVERLGWINQRGCFEPEQLWARSPGWRNRLMKDPLATAPQKSMHSTAMLQCAGAYSALGLALMPIFLGNDAGVTVGTGFDYRKDEELPVDLARATKALDPYASFYGWNWAANWWMFDASIKLPDAEKAAFESAWKKANETGAWDPILDKGFDALLGQNGDMIQKLTKIFQQAATREKSSYKTAVASPYRRVQWHSPMNFAAVDEVDLHYQCEQIVAPYYMMHQVDWYRRPGKRAWGHVEVYNESGTGEQMLGACLMMLMRAPDGIGIQSGMPPMFCSPWNAVDSRVSTRGCASVLQSMNRLAEQFGPLLAAAENADQVAIVVSSRMNRSDQSLVWTGRHFNRLTNAYMACLANHTPASFVYTEDLQANSLKKYKAVLVVDQLYEIEPPLMAALKEAQGAGVKVFYDQSCRQELVKDFTPLGIGFTSFDAPFGCNSSDLAFQVMPKRIAATADAMKQQLGFVRNSQPNCDNPEVYISTRRSGKTTYVIAVNNTMVPLDYGRMWRVSLFCSTRLPVVADITLPPELSQKPMYDMMSLQKLQPNQGKVRLDLRTLPMRIIAITDEAPRATDQPLEKRFGPHLRDAALSADGSTILFNAMNWDDNVYALNVADGQTRFQGKVGGYFAFAPVATSSGLYVQGFDFDAGEGYHLYQLGPDGKTQRRFALYGMAQRLPQRFVPHLIRDRINNFAVAPDGAWIASSGDLGLSVWDSQGQQLWKIDDWKNGNRQPKLLFAADAKTLLVASGMTLRAYSVGEKAAKPPAPIWEHSLAASNEINGLQVSRDGKTIAAMTTSRGGSVTILRDGKIDRTLAFPHVTECSLSPEGDRLAVVQIDGLSVIVLADGTRWSFHADSWLHTPRFSPDGQRLVACSEFGTLSVFNAADGKVLHSRDLQAAAVPVWLPNGDLIAGDWMGNVTRVGADYKTLWQAHVTPTNANVAATLKVPSNLPTVSVKDWIDALAKPLIKPEQLASAQNLLRQEQGRQFPMYVDFRTNGNTVGPLRVFSHMVDGTLELPPTNIPKGGDIDPDQYLTPQTIEGFAEGVAENWLELYAFNHLDRLESITFFEDPDRPDSWLRDLKLEMWDYEKRRWEFICPLMSDAAIHSHKLPTPVEGTRFRIMLPSGLTGNIRLRELVVQGKDLGSSHPDVRARKPVAVLFDENVEDLRPAYDLPNPPHCKFISINDAYSGSSVLSFTPVPGNTVRYAASPVMHWLFDIREKPKPGSYRYLQFAYRALSKDTTTISLAVDQADWIHIKNPKQEWQTMRVDLWKAAKGKEFTFFMIAFGAEGGPAEFDQILLGRTMNDFKSFGAPAAKSRK